MTSYIKVEHSESIFIKKNLLQTQYELLQSIKHHQSFEKLRKKELLTRINLKRKLQEVIENFKVLNKLLPKTRETAEKKIEIDEGRESLEKELQAIKDKLNELQ